MFCEWQCLAYVHAKNVEWRHHFQKSFSIDEHVFTVLCSAYIPDILLNASDKKEILSHTTKLNI